MPPVDDPLGLQLAEVQHRCASLFQVEQRQESAVTLDILDVVERCREICANFAEKVNAYRLRKNPGIKSPVQHDGAPNHRGFLLLQCQVRNIALEHGPCAEFQARSLLGASVPVLK